MTGVLTPTTPLTANDRCDRCGAQAFIRVIMPGGSELLFCAHHGREYDQTLRDVASEIQDETDKLTDTSSTAPDEER